MTWNDPQPARSESGGRMPERFRMPSIFAWAVFVGFLAFFIQGVMAVDADAQRWVQGFSNLGDFFSRALPPDLSNLDIVGWAMLETLNMAVVGVVFGVVLSVPMGLLAASNLAPHPVVRAIARGVVATLRTVPELVWALIFVAAVGLGPMAGILAIVMDTIGFCARFFAERFEEIPSGPADGIKSAGGGRLAAIGGAILPEALASMTATSLFGVEKAIRSAVILGLVGAGGIGVELNQAMSLFNYDAAMTIIIMIVAVVFTIEQVSSAIRRRVL